MDLFQYWQGTLLRTASSDSYFWDSLGRGKLPSPNSVTPPWPTPNIRSLWCLMSQPSCFNLRLAPNCHSPSSCTGSKDIHGNQHKPSSPWMPRSLLFAFSRLTPTACHSKLHAQWIPSQRWLLKIFNKILYHLNCKDNSKKKNNPNALSSECQVLILISNWN